jgi:hypothetical protein
MNPTRARVLLTVAATGLTLLACTGTAHAATAGTDQDASDSTRALYCVGIPYIHYGDTVIYPGGEVCVPGP